MKEYNPEGCFGGRREESSHRKNKVERQDENNNLMLHREGWAVSDAAQSEKAE